MIPSEWLDKNNHLISRPNVKNEDNGILFSAYYYYLVNDPNELNYILAVVGNFANKPNFLSHDNITGYLALAKKYNYIPELPDDWWKKYLHPRDIAFYYTLRGIKGLRWIVKLSAYISIKQKYKYRHKIQFTVPEKDRSFIQQARVRLTPILPFLFKDKVEIEDSSGKILAWLRCQVCGLGEWFSKQDVDINYFFRLYFNNQEDHPIIRALDDTST